MNAKLTILMISAVLGGVGGVGIAIVAGWGLFAGLLMYAAGGSLSMLAASLLILAAEVATSERPAHV